MRTLSSLRDLNCFFTFPSADGSVGELLRPLGAWPWSTFTPDFRPGLSYAAPPELVFAVLRSTRLLSGEYSHRL